jgi:hypothetical protein
MTPTRSGIEWIAAALAPWTISSHPNFSTPSRNIAADLALVTEGREKRERPLNKRATSTPSESIADAHPGWVIKLVSAASQAQTSDTQLAATIELIEISRDEFLPVGARAVAALFAAVSLADQDRSETAINILTDVIADRRLSDHTSPSTAICFATIYLQIALRNYDLGKRSDALAAARSALSVLPSRTRNDLEEFPVSPGISWGSKTVQQDISSSVRSSATALVATVEDSDRSAWESVIKSRSGWISVRTALTERSRDTLVVRDEFERHIDALSGTTHFMRDRAQASAYNALLMAELSGNISTTRASREALGKILMLQPDRSTNDAQEALRAFRRSGADKPLQATLNWLRNDGPSVVLRNEAAHLLRFAESPATSETLKILEYAAEFLPAPLLDLGVRHALSYSVQPRVQFRADWSYEDATWKTISRLVDSSGSGPFIAGQLLSRLQSDRPINQLVAEKMALTLSRTEWEEVDKDTRSALIDWAEKSEDDDANPIKNAILVSDGQRAKHTPGTVDLIVALINGHEAPDPSSLEASTEFIRQSIADELEEARQGSYSFGGLPILDLGVAFAAHFGSDVVWEACATALLDPSTHSMQKSAALDRLANSADKAPVSVTQLFSERWEELANVVPRTSLFNTSDLSVDAALVRACVALGVMNEPRAFEYVFSMSAESPMGRVEAARTLAYLVPLSSDSAQALLMQLSRDSDPDVRAEAGYSLASTASRHSGVAGLVYRRLSELATADGVRVALRVLHGFQFLQQAGHSIPEPLVPVVMGVASSGEAARVVRGAAQRVVSDAQKHDVDSSASR